MSRQILDFLEQVEREASSALEAGSGAATADSTPPEVDALAAAGGGAAAAAAAAASGGGGKGGRVLFSVYDLCAGAVGRRILLCP